MRGRTHYLWVLTAGSLLLAVSASGVILIQDRFQTPASAGDRVAALESATGQSGSVRAPAIGQPVRIAISSISVVAPVVATGMAANRAVAIPEDIRTVGWYAPGPRPGTAAGSAVIVGHRDGVVQGHGAFYNLALLDPGAHVSLTTSKGYVLDYTIVSREVIPKAVFGRTAGRYFTVLGPARLTLISCGGYFDLTRGGYQDNVVITALPMSMTTSTHLSPINLAGP